MKKILKSLFLILITSSIINPSFATSLDKNTLQFYSKNNILYYNPNGTSSCISNSSATTTSGNSQEEVAWNYFVNANIPNVSNNAAAIAGIVANLNAESGCDPFLQTSSYALIYQSSRPTADTTINKVNQLIPGASYLWHGGVGKEWTGTDLELAKKAIPIELDSFTGLDGTKNTYVTYFESFIKEIPNIKSQKPESFAELFEVWIEGAVADDRCVKDTSQYNTEKYESGMIEDSDVQASANKKYNSYRQCQNVPYQAIKKRRRLAREIYDKYASNTTTSSGGSSDGSTVTIIGDSITFASADTIREKLPQADIAAGVGMPFGVGINIAKDPTNDTSYRFDKYTTNLGKLKEPLRQNVIFALGTNNSAPILTERDIQDAIATIGTDKNIYFVTNYSKDETANALASNSQLLKKSAEANSNVHIIDWAAAAAQGDYLEPDQLHPNIEGQKLFAELIYNALNKTTGINICDPSSGIPLADGDIPWWSQIDAPYGGTYFGSQGYPATSGNRASVSSSACAVFSMASIISLLTHETVEPKTLLGWVGQENTYGKGYGEGYTNITTTFENTYAKHFPGLTYTSIKNTTGQAGGNFSSFKSQIETALKSGKYIIIAGQGDSSTTPYSSGGHFIVIRGIAADGNWLIINSGSDGHEDTFEKTHDPKVLWQYAYTAGIISL